MKKMVFGKKFSRDTTSRRAMYRALVRSFIANRSMVTTQAKARVIVPMLEKLIQKAKSASLQNRRAMNKFLGNDRETVDKIYELSKALSSKKGGYFKFCNLPARKGDNAPMMKISLGEKITVKNETDNKKKLQRQQNKTEVKQKKSSVSSVIKKLSLRKKTKK